MGLNKNVVLVLVALTMTIGMWMMPETISAQSNQKRLLQLTTYGTNPNRMAGVNKFCAGITRADLINTEEKATAESYKKQLASALNVNGNTFINSAINGNAIDEAMKITTPLGIFIGFFAIGFIIILIQWMCLCCCCCCPSCCPSRCCQKDENQQYTKCELYWPSIFLILLLLLIIIVSAMGISKAGTFKQGLGDIQCSLTMMLDDVVNGNVTTSGSSFFIGVDPLITQINALNNNITVVQSQLNHLGGNVSAISPHLLQMTTRIKEVPKDSTGVKADIVYKAKIYENTASTTGGTFESGFVTVLGAYNQAGSIIGEFYTGIDSTKSTLDGISTGASAFTGGISGFTGAVAGITADLNKVKTQMNDLDSSLTKTLDLMDSPKSMGTLVISIIYGVMLGLSVLALLGVVLMTFCDKYKCRYLMYFSCVILFFLGLLGFLIAIIFSIIVPVMFLLCEWLDVTITNTGFAGNTAKFISDTQVQNIIGSCLVGGSGDIIGAVGGASISTTINGLKDSVSKTNAFNTTATMANITAGLNNITSSIDKFKNGEIIDVLPIDTDSYIAFSNLANTQSLGACTSAGLDTDSYVVSLNPSSQNLVAYASCNLASGASINPTTCTQPNFASNSCHGCIDTSLIMNKWYSGSATAGFWKGKLQTRYGTGTGCVDTWVNYFGNVWDNYYAVKVGAFVGITTRWNLVADNTNPLSSVSIINSDMTAINSTMTNVINTLNSNVNAVVDPKFGLIAGLNCQIIGEDLQLVIGSICVSNFNTIYITRLLMGIAAFGILFAMCCIVCSGVRHFKHSERKDRVSPNFMGDKNSFEHTDAAFRP